MTCRLTDRNSSPLLDFTYTLDAGGNRTAVTGTRGSETYTLDELNRITQITYADGTVVEYAYDAAGNRTSGTVDGVTTTYAYDDASQLVSVGTTTYSYDDNGNLTSAGDNSFSWDWDNRLIAANLGGTTASYAYDGDGVRVSSSAGSESRSELTDRQAGLPAIVDDGTDTYLHADGLIASIDSSGDATYAHADALGSIRARSDAVGDVVGTTDYDVFGAARAEGGIKGLYGFTGEPQDATGLVHLRARTHDPATGRFLSPDTVRPGAPGTAGYHLYTYVANNPTTWIDPSGHSVAAARAVGLMIVSLAHGGVSLGVFGGLIVVALVLHCVLKLPGCRGFVMDVLRLGIDLATPFVNIPREMERDELRQAVKEHPRPSPSPKPEPPIVGEGGRGCRQAYIDITPKGLQHVEENHTEDGLARRLVRGNPRDQRASVFFRRESPRLLIEAAQSHPAFPDKFGRGCVRVVNAHRDIGWDFDGHSTTPIYSVVTTYGGSLRTAHPGFAVGL